MGAKQIDLSGFVFGRLTALEISGSNDYNGSKKRTWLCACECGNSVRVTTGNLKKSDGTKSCGCLHKEKAAMNGRNSRHLLAKPETGFNRIFSSYKANAKKRDLEWLITDVEARTLFVGACHYCGLEPSNSMETRASNFIYSGIDRVDNNYGYTLKNTVSCCSVCNHAKHTMGANSFEQWALKVARHISSRAIEEIDAKQDDGR